MQDDASIVFEVPALKEKVGLAIPSARYQNKSKDTVYGRTYGFVIMDEAHCARKHNQVHRAFRGLRERGLALVAMTATPVTTKAQVNYDTISVFLMLLLRPCDRICSSWASGWGSLASTTSQNCS